MYNLIERAISSVHDKFVRSQCHQHFMNAFCANILAPKITKLCFGFEIFWSQNIGKKRT